MKKTLKRIGEKMAVRSTQARCEPYVFYQPKPPVSIQKKMQGK